MIYNNQTEHDFKLMVIDLKQKFLNEKTNYDWNYSFTLEEYPNLLYFMIVNKFQCVKMIFDKEEKFISKSFLSKSDFTTFEKLMKDLKNHD